MRRVLVVFFCVRSRTSSADVFLRLKFRYHSQVQKWSCIHSLCALYPSFPVQMLIFPQSFRCCLTVCPLLIYHSISRFNNTILSNKSNSNPGKWRSCGIKWDRRLGVKIVFRQRRYDISPLYSSSACSILAEANSTNQILSGPTYNQQAVDIEH